MPGPAGRVSVRRSWHGLLRNAKSRIGGAVVKARLRVAVVARNGAAVKSRLGAARTVGMSRRSSLGCVSCGVSVLSRYGGRGTARLG